MNNIEKDLLLCYIVNGWEQTHLDKETFLPSACYYKDGKIADFMYDSFIFLPSPNYLYDYQPNGAFLKPLTKENWLDYIVNEELADGMNINALDEAVGEGKKALGIDDYKANVFMSMFYPVETTRDFGEVEGRSLDFANLEDRKAGLKWMVDKSTEEFNKRNYKNIRLAGFYWFCEEIDFKGENRGIVNYITDYIRELGMKTCWCPYFWAAGYQNWQEFGIDIAAQQANYFPEHHSDWPNCGGEERLPLVAKACEECGIGVGMEMGDEDRRSIRVFKKYLKAGVEYGFMHKPHIYYMGHGPKVINAVFNDKDEFNHSVYHELYKYIHRILKSEDVITAE